MPNSSETDWYSTTSRIINTALAALAILTPLSIVSSMIYNVFYCLNAGYIWFVTVMTISDYLSDAVRITGIYITFTIAITSFITPVLAIAANHGYLRRTIPTLPIAYTLCIPVSILVFSIDAKHELEINLLIKTFIIWITAAIITSVLIVIANEPEQAKRKTIAYRSSAPLAIMLPLLMLYTPFWIGLVGMLAIATSIATFAANEAGESKEHKTVVTSTSAAGFMILISASLGAAESLVHIHEESLYTYTVMVRENGDIRPRTGQKSIKVLERGVLMLNHEDTTVFIPWSQIHSWRAEPRPQPNEPSSPGST